jgi:serine/threonine protein kinase
MIICSACGGHEIEDGFCMSCGASQASPLMMPLRCQFKGDDTRATTPICSRSVPTPVSGYTKLTGRVTSTRRPTATQISSDGGGSGITGRRNSQGSGRRRASLGGGYYTMPPQASQDPISSLLINPKVPQGKAVCPACKHLVNPDKPFCANCGEQNDFTPKLKSGDVVARQYEIKGAIAFGGMGWIYLGFDLKLDRWVVLKGLLNSSDASSAAAAIIERRSLSEIKHGQIVGIYNFVQHAGESYIVMEYVGGKTLKEIRDEIGPMPAEMAISYILGIIPAFLYFERQKWVYCDFKPDNFKAEDDSVKLIDLGAMRRFEDPSGDVFGSLGYKAPEAGDNPSSLSDQFTVTRTLLTLMMDFDYSKTHEFTVPPPNELLYYVPLALLKSAGVDLENMEHINCSAKLRDGSLLPEWLELGYHTQKNLWYFAGRAPDGIFSVSVDLTVFCESGKAVTFPLELSLPLAEHESLFRFIQKGTATEPNRRFKSFDEMSEQLTGVQRDIASKHGIIPAKESSEFFPEREVVGTLAVSLLDSWHRLPDIKLDKDDPAAGMIMEAMSLAANDPDSLISRLIEAQNSFSDSPEACLRLANALIENRSFSDEKIPLLDRAASLDPWDWRPDFYCGKYYLSRLKYAEAVECFDRVYSELPGENVPRLALALALEGDKRYEEASILYDAVSRSDSLLSAAAFGLARCRKALGDRSGAVEAYSRVSNSVASHGEAQLSAALTLGDSSYSTPKPEDLVRAGKIIECMTRQDIPRYEAEAALALEVVKQIESGSKSFVKTRGIKMLNLFGSSMTSRAMKMKAYNALMKCARLSAGLEQSEYYVNRANDVRPITFF